MAGVTVSTSFNLGTGGGNSQASGFFIPLMKPVASSAILSLTNSGNDWMNITSASGTVNMNKNYSISKMEYQSQNNYWIQQKYYYQTGGIFLSQDNGATTRVAPPISIINSSAGATSPAGFTNTVVIAPITLDGGASIGGNGPVRVDSRLKANQTTLGPEKKTEVNISISCQDYTTAQMWNATFLEALSNGGITNKSWYRTGTTPSGKSPARAYVRIIGPFIDSTEDVWFTLHPAEFAVTFNNIASGIS
jgi:hypothetical protein